MTKKDLDLAAVRARLAQRRGKEYWRSLEELARSEVFRDLLRDQFPRQAAWLDGLDRREFLKLMGASLALAGLSACSPAPAPSNEKIVPYVRQPEEIVPGKPLFFATAFTLGGIASGLLVESHEGRPTKIEGNPSHPASLGSTDALAQASILTLYDPDRSQVVNNAGRISTWNAFLTAFNTELEGERLSGGAGLRLLTETVTSPTLANQLGQWLRKFPKARWHQYEPVNRENARAGARLAFGEDVNTYYRFDRAEVVLSLDSDFLFRGPGSVRYARDFSARRRIDGGRSEMNRLHAVEASPSVTGAMADHRLALRPSEIPVLARSIAAALGVFNGQPPKSQPNKWIDTAVRDLQRHRGASVIIAGDEQPAEVHALVHAMNHALDNVGKTVVYTDPIEASPSDQTSSLRSLVQDMEAGQVKILVIVGGNPVFTAPADLRFAERLAGVALRVHLSLYDDETSALCHWHIPETHYLESWSDARAYDGTVTILQPLIAPLYAGKSAHELLGVLTGQPGLSSYDAVRSYWKQQHRSLDFERFWRTAVHDGVVAGTAFPPKTVRLVSNFEFRASGAEPPKKPETTGPKPETL
ncbi:MAG TPA: TAT-variant-translocated molybdopterin oxidoreductase, partial [Candidatus Binatia bacterium]|nr:TAT-variant-translocated molybdopterin oxidoreductase [Candidatus Binatia bacterium]